MFSHVEPFAGDPILSLNEDFQKDPRPHKVNLSIGIYFDDAGRIPVLDCVRRAEAQMLEAGAAKPYLPIGGDPAARSAVQRLLFGAGHPVLAEKRVVTLQTVGSSGGLRVGADFIKRWRLTPGEKVGELWRPRQPITFYLDPSIPPEFIPTVSEGVLQLCGYLDRLGEPEGHLVVFDRRKQVSWANKIYIEEQAGPRGQRVFVHGA